MKFMSRLFFRHLRYSWKLQDGILIDLKTLGTGIKRFNRSFSVFYSMFWTCSRIRSSSVLNSTTKWAMSLSFAFEPIVLISRTNS